MTPVLHLAWHSLRNRRLSFGLALVSIALSVALLLGVERLRQDARNSFAQSLSGTDLVVGARSGPVQLLLYAVFHLGQPTHEIAFDSLEALGRHPQVAWWVPIALGDSHRGYRVIGSTPAYFEHVRHGDGRALSFAAGRPFDTVFEAVIGAEVAAALGYRPGDRIVLSHGAGGAGFAEHDDKPFTVVGILERSGTPNDRAVLIGLAGIEAIHLDWHAGAPIPGLRIRPDQVSRFDLRPKRVTAALVGLKNRAAVFQVQRHVHAYPDEPLLAILPGATLQELWQVVAVVEQSLLAISALVVAVGLAGLVATTIAGLAERRRELAILRALGAGPATVFGLLALESLALTVLGALAGILTVSLGGFALAPWLAARYGLTLTTGLPGGGQWLLLAAVLGAGLLASLIPGLRAYRYSLADGMSIRL